MGNESSFKKSYSEARKDSSNWEVLASLFVKKYPVKVTEQNSKMFKIEEKRVVEFVMGILQSELDPQINGKPSPDRVYKLLESCRRLFLSKSVFRSLHKHSMTPIIDSLKSEDGIVILSGIRSVINLLIFNGLTSAKEKDIISWEVQNRTEFLNQGGFLVLTSLLARFSPSEQPQIISAVMVLLALLLSTKSKATTPALAAKILSMLEDMGSKLLALCIHQIMDISYSSALLLKEVLCHSRAPLSKKIQDEALRRGIVVHVFYRSVFSNPEDLNDAVSFVDDHHPAPLSVLRDLFGSLCENNSDSIRTIFRILPRSFQSRLLEPFPKTEQVKASRADPVYSDVFATYSTKLVKRSNWPAFFSSIDDDHEQPDLVWNDSTRGDLRLALEHEIEELDLDDLSSDWDFDGFEVLYPGMLQELVVESYVVRLLIPALELNQDTKRLDPKELSQLIPELYNHAVIENRPTWKLACLRAVNKIYFRFRDMHEGRHFNHIPYLTWLLDPSQTHPIWRDHVLDFLPLLLSHVGNARTFLKFKGLDHLIFYLTNIHTDSEMHRNVEYQNETEADIETFPYPQVYEKNVVIDKVIALLDLLLDVVPRFRKRISRSYHFRHIIQFLLCDSKVLSAKALPLIEKIVDASPWVLPDLVHFGFFDALLFAVFETPHEAGFHLFEMLAKYHLGKNDSLVNQKSLIEAYFPQPLIRVLGVSGGKVFTDVFNGQSNEPHLIWNEELRQLFHEQIKARCSGAKANLSTQHTWIGDWEPSEVFKYPPIDDEICVGSIYLRLYNSRKDNGYRCTFPNLFVSSLTEALGLELPDQDLTYVLDALQTVIERHPHEASIQEFLMFSHLCKCLTRDATSVMDVYMVMYASECLHGLLKFPRNAKLCFDNGGVQATSSAILRFSAKSFEVEDHVHILCKLFRCLNVLTQKIHDSAVALIASDSALLATLTKLLSVDIAKTNPVLVIEVLQLCVTFGHYLELREAIMEVGAPLFFIHYSIFGSSDDNSMRKIVTESANALSSFAGHHFDSPTVPQKDSIRDILRGLLTQGLVRELVDPEKFIELARDNTVNPVLIWNESLRTELRVFLDQEMEHVHSNSIWKGFGQKPFDFFFKGLSEEIVVDDVYLYIFNKDFEYSIPNSPEELMGRILVAIHAVSMELDQNVENIDPEILGYRLHFVSVCAISLHGLIDQYPEILQSDQKDFLVKTLTELFENSEGRSHLYQIGLLVLERLVISEITALLIVTPFRHVLHRLLNISRNNLSEYPHLTLVLSILSRLCNKNPIVVVEFCDSGLLISLMNIFARSTAFWEQHRIMASEIIGILCNDNQKGDTYLMLCRQLISRTFQEELLGAQQNPKKLIKYFDKDWDTPVRFWTPSCRLDLLDFLDKELHSIISYQSEALFKGIDEPPFVWDWGTLQDRFHQYSLTSQICIDNVYVNAFNANPFFQVHPDKFWVKLFEGLHIESDRYIRARDNRDEMQSKSGVARLFVLWEAVENLLINLPHLQENCVNELEFIFSFFDSKVHTALQEIVLKIACTISTNAACAESIAKLRLLSYVLPLVVNMQDSSEKVISILNLLMDVIRRSSPAVEQIRQLGGLLLLLDIVLDEKRDKIERRVSAQIISAMIQDNIFGRSVAHYMTKVLTLEFKEIFHARPERFVAFVGEDHESVEDDRLWTEDKRRDLRNFVAKESMALSVVMPHWDGMSDLWDISKMSAVWGKLSVEEN